MNDLSAEFYHPLDVPDKDHLYSLSAGAPVSPEVERDDWRDDWKRSQIRVCKRTFYKWFIWEAIL